jgi:hypothetical protein
MTLENVKVLKEVTEWEWPNHTYLLSTANDKSYGKMVAYIKSGTEEIKWFSNPMSFSKSYRKFKEVTLCLM